jgi:uncharacterized protein (UPF0254 family)
METRCFTRPTSLPSPERHRRLLQTVQVAFIERGHVAVESAVKRFTHASEHGDMIVYLRKESLARKVVVVVAMTIPPVKEIQKAIRLACWEAMAPHNQDVTYRFEDIESIMH